MSRDYKNFAPGKIFHVYNRGNNKEKIFLDEQDYRAFLFRLGLCLGLNERDLNSQKLLAVPYSRIRINNIGVNNFKIHAFCLMPNHFHLIIEQLGDMSISKLILKITTSYSKFINNKYKRVGHIVQDRFKSILIETNPQLMWTSSYVHMNPVKDKLVSKPSDYLWSSYNDYAQNRNLPIINKDLILKIFGSKKDFIEQTFTLSEKDN